MIADRFVTPGCSRPDSRGFSLVEIVVAIGIFVVGVLAMVALLSSTTNSAANTLDTNGAVRAGESAAVWARQLTWAEALQALGADPTDAAIYANRDGELSEWDGVAEADAFYAVSLERNVDLSPSTEDEVAGFLAMRLTVSWPVWQSPTSQIPFENRDTITFNVAVRR
ncbi:prepilin-type N-terminal cleavage/methylation domain-containing protein [Actomonas aquatica]|uniref:Prepilin-type N-terminal cleavage/methylation domain-containing protein n=1 Tax=Actomonas aquatica TaxID=2866162 RepID=A0ABZ1CCU6_9BACT|nr:prepilin-type N-terminal cleavage/methylation domain-containing protein [Opitutus sp. WL0086]WRQ88125.1 prepilin-type N-terminal cleavage/methylation domain-containing protein [Opitutus sp. WL0086]